MLQSMLYFPESERETGKLKKVQYIVKHFIEQFWFYYMSKREVIIDESLMGFEEWAPAIQYKPNKHHPHFGFKLFCLCESDIGYTVNFLIYEGKSNTVSEYGISHDVCIQLMGLLLDMKFHLYMGNWYTAVPLAEALLSKGTNLKVLYEEIKSFYPKVSNKNCQKEI